MKGALFDLSGHVVAVTAPSGLGLRFRIGAMNGAHVVMADIDRKALMWPEELRPRAARSETMLTDVSAQGRLRPHSMKSWSHRAARLRLRQCSVMAVPDLAIRRGDRNRSLELWGIPFAQSERHSSRCGRRRSPHEAPTKRIDRVTSSVAALRHPVAELWLSRGEAGSRRPSVSLASSLDRTMFASMRSRQAVRDNIAAAGFRSRRRRDVPQKTLPMARVADVKR